MGKGESKFPEKLLTSFMDIPKNYDDPSKCNMTPPLGGPLAWDVNIYFFIFLCLHYSQSPTSYRHIQKAPFCVQFDILLAWKKIGKEIFCFIGMQLRIRRKKKGWVLKK